MSFCTLQWHSLAILSAALHCDWLNLQTAGVAESWKKLKTIHFRNTVTLFLMSADVLLKMVIGLRKWRIAMLCS